eukprot:gene8180-1436_t
MDEGGLEAVDVDYGRLDFEIPQVGLVIESPWNLLKPSSSPSTQLARVDLVIQSPWSFVKPKASSSAQLSSIEPPEPLHSSASGDDHNEEEQTKVDLVIESPWSFVKPKASSSAQLSSVDPSEPLHSSASGGGPSGGRSSALAAPLKYDAQAVAADAASAGSESSSFSMLVPAEWWSNFMENLAGKLNSMPGGPKHSQK